MLIGAADQSRPRCAISTGNYGLVSHEEITQTGVDAKQAVEMMRLKLKFAFGRIRPTHDFIDSRILADGTTESQRGDPAPVGSNIFEFAYKGETVTVDLNLNPEKF